MATILKDPTREISPLKTWKELLDWKEPSYLVREIVFGKELYPRAPPYGSELKTLVCHDFKEIYVDDKYYSGTDKKDAYRFYSWSGVDIFVYFSQNLVTIPPPCWVSAAHLHGVRVLGTFITKGDEGVDICRKLLSYQDSVNSAVSQLVDIAKYHRFEGWLINIENQVDFDKVAVLVEFVKKLTAAMRELCPESVVIWYDGVTKEGKHEWQSELNDKNRSFFDVCDGIFLHFAWTRDSLDRTQIVAEAAERNGDVYVGLDIWANTHMFYGGGGFHTHRAMAVARGNNLSVAIFAPAWTYELHQEQFDEAEDQMWRSFAPYLYHHGPKYLPFSTSFCQGFGERKVFCAELVRAGDWHKLDDQQYQPIWTDEERTFMSIKNQEPFSGGGCLEIVNWDPATVRLFVCDIKWREHLLLTMYYKWHMLPVPLNYVFHFEIDCKDKALTKEDRSVILEFQERVDKVITSGLGMYLLRQGTLEAHVVDSSLFKGWSSKTFQIREEEGMALTQFDVHLDGSSVLHIGKLEINNIYIKGPLQ